MARFTAFSSRLSSGLQQALIRLGVLPCAITALVLTLWFTQEKLSTLQSAFNAEGNAIARQIAAVSGLSLYSGDVDTLNAIANSLAARVQISNGDNITIDSGAASTPTQARSFTAPVRLRPVPGSAQDGIRSVAVFLDDSLYRHERLSSMFTGAGIGGIAL
ncbi:MAG: hypothetical protein LBE21_04970, partial [Pseudomonadales bacterium]|nr:hypothetical protein [Pseudomonadales bacterium]